MKAFKHWKQPKDETRDHMNFLQHLAGARQVDVTPSGQQGKFDTSVEANTSYLHVKKASGRVPFNASLLTAGQVKFGAHEMSARVRNRMSQNMSQRGASPNASREVYDNVYAILENKRAARKSADHFGRPKILSDHLKEVEKSSKEKGFLYGYETRLHNNRVGQNGSGTNDTYKVDWNEFRAYVYGAKTLRDIKDPIIEDLVRRNRDIVIGASNTLNPTTTILAALKIASNFWVTEETGGGIGTRDPEDGDKSVTEGLSEDQAEELQDDVVAETIDDVTAERIENSIDDPTRTLAGLDPLKDSATFDDVVNDFVDTAEQIKNTNLLDTKCDGIIDKSPRLRDFSPTMRVNVELSDNRDVAGKMLGNNGQRVSRNIWKLSAFGDTNVFEKHPYTSADMIVLADCSSSMGSIHNEVDPMRISAEISTAIKERFPDAHMYGFDTYRGDKDANARLIPFGRSEYPTSGGSTPLCGAMKGLENLHNLSEASVLIITDGQPNYCNNASAYRDATLCCQMRAKAWRSRGVRFATIYIGSSFRQEPLPVELSVTVNRWNGVSTEDIKRVFEFFRR